MKRGQHKSGHPWRVQWLSKDEAEKRYPEKKEPKPRKPRKKREPTEGPRESVEDKKSNESCRMARLWK